MRVVGISSITDPSRGGADSLSRTRLRCLGGMVVAWAVLHETESCSPTSHTPRGRGRGRDWFRGPGQEGPATSNSAPRRDRAKGRSEATSPRDPNRCGVDHAVGQVVRPHVSRSSRGSRDVAIARSSRRHPCCLGVCRRSLARLTAGAPDAAKNAAAGPPFADRTIVPERARASDGRRSVGNGLRAGARGARVSCSSGAGGRGVSCRERVGQALARPTLVH